MPHHTLLLLRTLWVTQDGSPRETPGAKADPHAAKLGLEIGSDDTPKTAWGRFKRRVDDRFAKSFVSRPTSPARCFVDAAPAGSTAARAHMVRSFSAVAPGRTELMRQHHLKD